MNDPINTQDFALVDEARFAEIFREDSQTRQQLKECTPADQRAGVWNNHEGAEL